MSNDQNTKISIIREPQYFLSAQAKTLDERLKHISLSEEEKSEIVSTKSKRLVRDKVLGFFKIGEIIKEVLDWNENVESDIKEAKKSYLMNSYFELSEDNSEAVKSLRNFLVDPQGNTLFNKILRISDDNPPDAELFGHLGAALHFMTNGNFAKLFGEHKYALSQIEQLTPQALTILADGKSWPIMSLNGYSSNDGKLTSDWLNDFAPAYWQSKGLGGDNPAAIVRLRHAISDLINKRFIEAHLIAENTAKCEATEIGRGIIPYLCAP